MSSILNKKNLPDGSPTISEWPIRIWEESELPEFGKQEALKWMKGDFSEYDFVYAPKRKTAESSYSYLFGYGKNEIYYHREFAAPITLKRNEIKRVDTKRELLMAAIILHYRENGEEKNLEFPYVPSTYYLYDPFLNWTLRIDKTFVPAVAERDNPRPKKLYEESLPMFNYSLGAYRLGERFEDYEYRSQVHRHKLMPWKKTLEEWLEVPMQRGIFKLHSFVYLTECTYLIS